MRGERPPPGGWGGGPRAGGNPPNAVSALAGLGYTPAEAAAVVAQFDSALPTEELIRLSLKAMGSKF